MTRSLRVSCVVVLAAVAPKLAAAQSATAPGVEPPPELARALALRGARYLLSAQQRDGGWVGDRGPGVTCLVLRALIQEPAVGPRHEAVRRGLEFVRRAQRDDGGIYGAEGSIKNYETSVALSMLSALGDAGDAELRAAAQRFLIEHQWDEGDGKSIDDPFYGGAGYGSGQRPDLSNTQMMLEALHDSGLPKDDPAFRKALVFISRCQMLAEHNDQSFARGSTDGGFIYSPARGGESKAGEVRRGGRTELRSYGTMTYAGFKSLLYAGVGRDDPRVRAALEWIRRHWTLEFNPNMPEQRSREGLFYYYHVFARALAAWGEDVVTDAAGRRHEWRGELVEKLARLQRSDGSWVNEHDRWMEGYPELTTAYSIMAIQAAFPPAGAKAP